MIDTHVYQILAELPSGKKDERGRTLHHWTPVFWQVKNETFQYTEHMKSAFHGDYKNEITRWKVINMAENNEEFVKLEQIVRHKDQIPKTLLIKEDESCSHDFYLIWRKLDDLNKVGKEVGRPITINMNTGRGVSALSRNAENVNYRGIVSILVILLLLSNIQHILKTVKHRGWVFGAAVYNNLTDFDNYRLSYVLYLLWFQFVITCPSFSFVIEKYIAPNPKVSRKLIFFLIVLNMAYILLFPMWCAHFAEIHPLLRAVYFMISSIGFLKLLSYHHIWHDIRYHVILANKPVLESKNDLKNEDSKSKDDVKVKSTPKNSEDLKILAVDPTLTADCLMKKLNLPKHTIDDIMKYPNNVKAWDLIVFNFAPTLNFQLAFPFSNNPSLFKFVFGIFKYLILLGLWVTIVQWL